MDLAIKLENLGKMYKLYNRPNDKILEAFGLSRWFFWRRNFYQEYWALRDLNLEVEKGERLGIVGKNGAGKSTLLKLIAGNITSTEGNIKVYGRIQALMELGTGFHPEFTGRENIRASLSYHGINTKKIKKIEEEIVDFTELEEFINQPIKVYSSGMYARLAFAVATVLEPEILIIDEILGAGDASFNTKCALRMKKLTEENGATVLFVSHSMESVLEMCNRAILIHKGTVLHDSDPLTISKIYNNMIREEDELVLRAKESRLRKRDCQALKVISPDFQPLLFRLNTDHEHPRAKHLIYGLSIYNSDSLIGEIKVGSPMDNDINSPNRIIDGIGMMDWGRSQKSAKSFFRAYQNEDGLYCHAPFQLCVPKHLMSEPGLTLKIKADINKAENVYVDLWLEDRYERLTSLTHENKTYNISISEYLKPLEIVPNMINFKDSKRDDSLKIGFVTKVEGKPSSNINTDNDYTYDKFVSELSIYGTKEIIVEYVDLLDADKKSKRVFFVGETLEFKISLISNKKVSKFFVVASILTVDGRPASQAFCDSSKLGLVDFEGEAVITLQYSPLRFGPGEYIVSLGLFKEYDLSTERENESYCVVDRAVFFKVVQPESIKKVLGAFSHSVIWQCGDKKNLYDPSCHFIQG